MLDNFSARILGDKEPAESPELSTVALKRPLRLQATELSEHEYTSHIRSLSQANLQFRSFIGMGYYPCEVPSVIMRNVFESAAWQNTNSESTQGKRELLKAFEGAIGELTQLDAVSLSPLDEGAAATEAMLLMHGQAIDNERNILFIDENIFPQTLDILLTRCETCGVELVIDSFREYQFTGKEFGAIVQYPSAVGLLEDYATFTHSAHESGAQVAVIADLLALALFTPPGAWGADIAVGSAQRLGLPMGFGGAAVGYIAARKGYELRRETMPQITVMMAALNVLYVGAEGLCRMATTAHCAAKSVAAALKAMKYLLVGDNFFDTIDLEAEVAVVQSLAEEREINFFYPSDGRVRISFDSLTTVAEIEAVVEIFTLAKGRKPRGVKIVEHAAPDAPLRREGGFWAGEIFYNYRLEAQMLRYIREIEDKELLPLDSTPSSLMCPLSLSGFQNMHPFAPEDQTVGYSEMIGELEGYLSTLSGLDSCSLQPNSTTVGQYTALMVVRAYYQNRGQGYRNIALVPSSMHDQVCATAQAAGLSVVAVECDSCGVVDVKDLEEKVNHYSSQLSVLMLSYPWGGATLDGRIRDIIDLAHDVGAQLYFDGAFVDSLSAISTAGYLGADLCQVDLHRSFALPRGCAELSPICFAEHLSPFRPSHYIASTGGECGITAVASAPWGSALLLLVAYGYIKMMGESGLRRASLGRLARSAE